MKLASHVLLTIACCALFVAVFAACSALASARTALGARLGMRGLKRARALQAGGAFSHVEPVMRWVGTRVSPLVNGRARGALDRQIMLAGDMWGLSPEEYVALSMIAGVTGGLFGCFANAALHQSGRLIAVAGLVGLFIPYFLISREAQRRVAAIQTALPYMIDLVSLSLSAGLDFPGALRQIADKTADPNDPLGEEVSWILQELLIGKTRRQALIDFGARVPGESVREFVSTVVQAEERGNPLCEVLRIQATSSRLRRSVRAEEQAAKAGLKMVVPCLFVFAAVVLLIAAPMFLNIEPLLGS